MEKRPPFLRALFDKHRELVMYCVFGVSTTILNWLIYSLYVRIMPSSLHTAHFPLWLERFLQDDLHLDTKILMAGVIAWIIAVIFAFVTNKLWVFESKSWNSRLVTSEALTFFGGRIATGLLEVVAVPAFVSWGFDMKLFGVDGLPAKIAVSVAIVILNYILSKFVSFRRSDEEAE